jgi:hypothetical protein
MKPGGGRVHDRVEVGCYAGGRGDETPRVVLLGGRELAVRVERRWIEEPVGSGGSVRRRQMFQVQLGDGRRCLLAQEPDGSWTLAHTTYGREPSGRLGARGAARRMVDTISGSGPVASPNPAEATVGPIERCSN